MSSNLKKGIYLALITACISGVSVFVNKIAVDIIKPPLVFTAEKNALVGLSIIGVLLLSRRWKKVKNLQKKEIINLILIGIIGGSLPFYLFFTGLATIPAVNGAIIQKTLVIWVTILAIPLLKERFTPLQFLAVTLLFFSNLVVGGFAHFQYSLGELMVLGATILWAIENIIAKKILPSVDPDILTSARMGIGSIILLAASLFAVPEALFKSFSLTPAQWFWMSISVILLLGYVTSWYRALKFAPAITVTSVLVSATLVTNILSAIFVTHKWTMIMGAQAFLVTLGIVLFWLAAGREITKIKRTPKIEAST